MKEVVARSAARRALAEAALVDPLLTPKDVEAEYGFSTQTTANWRWMGTGPDFIKQTPGKGGRIKYRRSSIERWLSERTVTSGSAAA